MYNISAELETEFEIFMNIQGTILHSLYDYGMQVTHIDFNE